VTNPFQFILALTCCCRLVRLEEKHINLAAQLIRCNLEFRSILCHKLNQLDHGESNSHPPRVS
jgi:hypothetical protein